MGQLRADKVGHFTADSPSNKYSYFLLNIRVTSVSQEISSQRRPNQGNKD